MIRSAVTFLKSQKFTFLVSRTVSHERVVVANLEAPGGLGERITFGADVRLARIAKVNEEGAVFRSHIDGRLLELTPERAVRIQDFLKELTHGISYGIHVPPYGLDRDRVSANSEAVEIGRAHV